MTYKVNETADYSNVFQATVDGVPFDIRYHSDAPVRILLSEKPEQNHSLEEDITIVEVLNCETMVSEDLSTAFGRSLIRDAMKDLLQQADEEYLRVISSWSTSMVYEGPD
jgi:hypothetical protein